jgi:hypothetical protein
MLGSWLRAGLAIVCAGIAIANAPGASLQPAPACGPGPTR